MRRAPTLPKLHQGILEYLAASQHATNAQLARGCAVQAPAVSKAVQKLLAANLIDGSLLTRPMILHLTSAGGRMLGVSSPSGRPHASWSVMAHACHRNAAQEMLGLTHPGFRFLSRVALFKQGFNPAFGEHGAIDDAGTAWFVMLDDYMMGSERITRSWTRRHTPKRQYWPDATGRVWGEVAQRFLVVSTDARHAARHREWILRSELPAEVRHLPPLWPT